MNHEFGSSGSGSSNTLRTNLITDSPNESSSNSPRENQIENDNPSPSSNQPDHIHRETVTELENIITSFRNEECSKTQALAQLLDIINHQNDISDFQKGQTYDLYYAEILSLESSQKKAGKRAVHANSQASSQNFNESRNVELPTNSIIHTTPPHQSTAHISRQISIPRRDHEQSRDDSSEDDESDDSRSSNRPHKRPRLRESDMPWYSRFSTSNQSGFQRQHINSACLKNAELLFDYAEDRKHVKKLICFSPYAPDNIPSSQWDRIIKGEPVDLNAILSALHHTGIDKERTGSIGDKEISLTVSESKRTVRNGFDWSQAWRRAAKAIGFLFPQRIEELETYGDYIENLFAAKSQSSSYSIVLFDIAVRNFVQGGQRHLLTDIQQFSALYTAIVLPDGVESSRSQPIIPSRGGNSGTTPRASGSRVEICIRFNSQNGCPSSDAECRYRHICRKCRRAGHGQAHCNAEKK